VGTSALDCAWLESTFHDAYLAVTEELKLAPFKETGHSREARPSGQFDIAFSSVNWSGVGTIFISRRNANLG
jgi:hypothetical protein